MTSQRFLATALAAGALLAGASACGDDSDPDPLADLDLETTTIAYSFHDSSVEPEYHRSYDITVTASGVTVVVDSYGDVLADAQEQVPSEAWEELLDTAIDLEELPTPVEEVCDGGTSGSLEITSEDEVVYQESYNRCGGSNEEVADGLRAYVEPALVNVDMDALLE